MASRTLSVALIEAFHSVPEECWTPSSDTAGELRAENYWLRHLYRAENEITSGEKHWALTGSWPVLSERARYFLHTKLEDVLFAVNSENPPALIAEVPHLRSDGELGRSALNHLVGKIWTREFAQMWASEAARYGSPRRSYMPALEKDSLPGSIKAKSAGTVESPVSLSDEVPF